MRQLKISMRTRNEDVIECDDVHLSDFHLGNLFKFVLNPTSDDNTNTNPCGPCVWFEMPLEERDEIYRKCHMIHDNSQYTILSYKY